MPESAVSLLDSYQSRLAAGDIRPNPAQAEIVHLLQIAATSLQGYGTGNAAPTKSLMSLFQRFVHGDNQPDPAPLGNGKCGIYLYGQVGRGKSMLMDLFMEHVAVTRKRRVHFHQFMLEIHARLKDLRQEKSTMDSMDRLAQGIAAETSLLAFDEFHVGNIADAMILGRLLSGLFAAGVVIIATSNWAPDDLYKNGLQRDRFLPFIDLIKQKMKVCEIGGKIDYRFEQLRNLQSYFHPLGLETTRRLQGLFFDLTHDAPPETVLLLVMGRELIMSRAAQGIGFFNFDELCQRALSAADYLAIARCLHTVILDGVPVFKSEQRDETVRFMTLIDTLYEARVKLFMASDVAVELLTAADDLALPFQRTISRLMEMEGELYRLKSHLS